MSEQNPEKDPKPEPLKFDTPVFDIVEKSADKDVETRDIKPGESK